MEKRKVYIINGNNAYRDMFIEEGWEIVHKFEEADLIQFTGGEDVSPHMYGEAVHPRTRNNINRDLAEKVQYHLAQEFGIACAGICRGGQFLNVMNGGSMYQDVDGHARSGTHPAYMYGTLVPVSVTSTHHQMIRPNYDTEVMVLMTARESTFKEHMDATGKVSRFTTTTARERSGLSVGHLPDIESVYYPDSNTLCFQPHPEFVSAGKDCRRAYFHLINNYLFDDNEEFVEVA